MVESGYRRVEGFSARRGRSVHQAPINIRPQGNQNLADRCSKIRTEQSTAPDQKREVSNICEGAEPRWTAVQCDDSQIKVDKRPLRMNSFPRRMRKSNREECNRHVNVTRQVKRIHTDLGPLPWSIASWVAHLSADPEAE